MGEVSEGGHEDESDDLGLSSEMVRVNLADSESELGLPVMVQSPLEFSSDDAEIGVLGFRKWRMISRSWSAALLKIRVVPLLCTALRWL